MAQKRMTERQRRFAEAYWAMKDARQAAEQAGYPPGFGERLLQVASVRSFLDQRAEDERRTAVASADEVLQYLTRVLRADSGQSSMKAAELLGKRLGLFSEQAESLPKPVIVDDLRRMPDGGRTERAGPEASRGESASPPAKAQHECGGAGDVAGGAQPPHAGTRRKCGAADDMACGAAQTLPAEARHECSAVGDAACEAAQPPPAGTRRKCGAADDMACGAAQSPPAGARRERSVAAGEDASG